jgi:hypothetical protein
MPTKLTEPSLNGYTPAPKRKRGRPPGSPNKPKDYQTRLSAREACSLADLNPFKVLADIAKNSKDENLRRLAAGDLCEYLEPKLKRLDVVGDAQPTNIIITWGEPTGGGLVDGPDALTIDHQD